MTAIVDFDTIPQLFLRLEAHYEGRNRTVLRYKDRQSKCWIDISWEALLTRVEAMAGFLHARGVRSGDRVAILSENRPEWPITDLATQLLGAVNVALYTSLPPDQVQYILADSGAKVFVVSTGIQLKKAEKIFKDCPNMGLIVTMSKMRKEHPDYVQAWEACTDEGAIYWAKNKAELRQLADEVKPEDLSAIIYTSGTTGNPKGVMLTHHNFCVNIKSSLAMVRFTEEDHHLSFLPLCHAFERTAGYSAVLACGGTITYAESTDAVSRNLVEVHPTVLISVPRVFEKVYNAINKSVNAGSSFKKRVFEWSLSTGKKAAAVRIKGKSPGPVLRMEQRLAHRLVFSKIHDKMGGHLRFAVSGGAALPRAIGEFFQAAGICVIEGYGLTETAPVLSANPLEHPRYGTVGHVLPGINIGIQRLDDKTILGQLSGEDYPSDLTTAEGEIIVRGDNVMKGYWNDDAATRVAIDAEGWYHTGDVGRYDAGYLTITDRIKHMIVSKGGKNIYPGPLEDLFKTVPWIDQLMIVGEGREFLTALVVPDLDALAVYAREHGYDYSQPDKMLAQEEIQKLFSLEFRRHSRNAAAHEKIRDFRLITEPFTVDNGMMTPTLKPRRRAVDAHYADIIDEMYEKVV